MSEKKFNRIMNKLYPELYNKTIYSADNRRIHNYMAENSLITPDGEFVMIEMSDVIIKKAAKNNNINTVSDSVGIYSEHFSLKTQRLIELLCDVCNNLSLFTYDLAAAEIYLNSLCFDTGICIPLSDNPHTWLAGKKMICFVGKVENNICCDAVKISFGVPVKNSISEIEIKINPPYSELLSVVGTNADKYALSFLTELGFELESGRDFKVVSYGYS